MGLKNAFLSLHFFVRCLKQQGLRARFAGSSPGVVPTEGDGDPLIGLGIELFLRTLVLFFDEGESVGGSDGSSGYEGKNGEHVVQVHATNSWKIQYIGLSELCRFGFCCTAFSHRKGIVC